MQFTRSRRPGSAHAGLVGHCEDTGFLDVGLLRLLCGQDGKQYEPGGSQERSDQGLPGGRGMGFADGQDVVRE